MIYIFTIFHSWLLILCSYFCFWIISKYLLLDPILAIFFLPFALRSGVVLHTKRFYWLSAYFAEWVVLALLYYIYLDKIYFYLFFLSLVSIPLSFYFTQLYHGDDRRKLFIQVLLGITFSLINSLAFWEHNYFYVFLINFTGILIIIPFCYLLNDFLFNRKWLPITSRLVRVSVSFKVKHIFIYLLFFIINIAVQIYLPNEFFRFGLFFLSIPIIILSVYYNWQGAIFASLINSISLIVSTHNLSNLEIKDIFLSISLQTIVGIFLGLNMKTQKDLNKYLSVELEKNKKLTKKLINAENDIKKEISQELHDEIGQNITAIRTQAMILKKLNPTDENLKLTAMIDKLSLNIYDSVKGLLNRIRPRILDDLSLKDSIQNLFAELGFEQRKIKYTFEFINKSNLQIDNVLEIMLYRICQESLNNIIKYSKSTRVFVHITIDNNVSLIIEDNGIGMSKDNNKFGLGIKGMKERVEVLYGEFNIQYVDEVKKIGTRIIINLPKFIL